MIARTRPPAVPLEQLVARGLIHDIAGQPAPNVFSVALGFLSSAPGGALTTRAFTAGALARAGKRMLGAGGEPDAVRNALKLVQTTWHYAWRLNLVDAAPDELPAIAAGRPDPAIPTPDEVDQRKAKVRAGLLDQARRARRAAAEAEDVEYEAPAAKPRRKKAKLQAAIAKASICGRAKSDE